VAAIAKSGDRATLSVSAVAQKLQAEIRYIKQIACTLTIIHGAEVTDTR